MDSNTDVAVPSMPTRVRDLQAAFREDDSTLNLRRLFDAVRFESRLDDDTKREWERDKHARDRRHFKAQVIEHIDGEVSMANDATRAINMCDMLEGFDALFHGQSVTLDEMVRRHEWAQHDPTRAPWLVAGLLRPGGVSIISSDPKCGKSTFARCLAMAVAGNAKRFLGREVTGGPVYFVELDEPSESAFEHYAQIEIRDASLHQWQDHGGVRLPPKVGDRFAWLTNGALDLGAILIVVDTMFRFRPAGGNNGIADYGLMAGIMTEFQKLAVNTGAHVVLLHHHAKGAEGNQRSPLGSQAIGGAVDTLMTITRDGDGARYLQADGRGVTVPRTRLEFDDGWIALGMSTRAESARNKRAELMAAIEAKPGELTMSEAVGEAHVDRTEGMKLLRAMLEDNTIMARPKDGRRGHTLWPAD